MHGLCTTLSSEKIVLANARAANWASLLGVEVVGLNLLLVLGKFGLIAL